MKKISLFLTVLILSGSVFAGGKLQLQNNFFHDGKDYRPTAGFSVYQRLNKQLASNSWVGAGVFPLEERADTKWFVAKTEIQMDLKKDWVLSPGVTYKQLLGENERDMIPYLKAEFKLW